MEKLAAVLARRPPKMRLLQLMDKKNKLQFPGSEWGCEGWVSF
jgi:hypothetical protein